MNAISQAEQPYGDEDTLREMQVFDTKLNPVYPVDDGGVYCLVLHLRSPRWFTVGRLGTRRLGAGHYVYTGSAKKRLTARLRRHLRQEKTLHWHIDHLCAVMRVVRIWVLPWTEGAECRTNALIQALPGAGVPWTGFGSSDCGCGSHLTVLPCEPRSVPRLVSLRGARSQSL